MLPVSDILGHVSGGAGLKLEHGHKIRFMSNEPPVVVWNITNQCNMTCPHCYSSAKQKPDANELTLEQAYSVIASLKAAGIKIVIFSGGEPLLRPDWSKIIRRAREAGMSCHLSTNGVLLTPDIAAKLKDLGVFYVGVSLDGMPEFNDTYRNYKNGFSAAVAGISNARAAGLMTGIRITLSGKNEEYLFPLIEQAGDLGVSRFYVSHLVYGGRGIRFAAEDQETSSMKAQMNELFNFALASLNNHSVPRIVTGGNDADGVALYLFIRDRLGEDAAAIALDLLEKRGGNSAGEKMINIDHTGKVHPDQFWRSVSPGNILEHPLSELLHTGIMAQLPDRTSLLKGRCGICRYQSICRGSHRERAEIIHGDVWAEDPSCYITDEEISPAGINHITSVTK